jgi:hypothetical protein
MERACRSPRCPSVFWSSLPCRESEIAFVNDFIADSFSSEHPRILAVGGGPRTGKTSALHLCASMSRFHRQIEYIDCLEVSPFPDTDELFGARRLIIFDNLDPIRISVRGLLEFYEPANWSFIFVTPADILSYLPIEYSPSAINFSRYTPVQLFDILKEKACEFEKGVSDDILSEISQTIDSRRGTVDDAVDCLLAVVGAEDETGGTRFEIPSEAFTECDENGDAPHGFTFGFGMS